MKKYVLGFAFDSESDPKYLVLIEKQKPNWQKGKLNGVGGKVELDDISDKSAMVREFQEETGLDTELLGWKHFATMKFPDDVMGGSAVVYCYKYFSNRIFGCSTTTDEVISMYALHPDSVRAGIPLWCDQPLIKNLHVLIPMALDKDFRYAELTID